MTRLLLDRLDTELVDYRTGDGDPLSEELGSYVRSQLIEEIAKLIIDAHQEA